jgi:hypothetical protein
MCDWRMACLIGVAPIMNIVPSGTASGSTICMGNVLTIVWILGR